MTPHEWMEKTVRDLEKRRMERERGIRAADSHIFDMQSRAFKDKSKIRNKSYRGK